MTITQLKYVLAVAKYQNFTTASEHCFVTQPTLSMQIHKLEESLDIQIFNRNKKPIELTDVGKKIVAQAKIIVNESNRITDIVDQEKGYIGGEFRIGIIPTIMPSLLPLFLKNFNKKYPKVELVINELTTAEIIQKLKDGYLDAAIAATPLNDDSIVESPMYYEPFIALVNPNHRLHNEKFIDPQDLSLDDLLLLEDGHCFKESVLNICSSLSPNSKKQFALQSGSFNTLIKLTKEGMGMTLLPYLHSLDLNSEDKNLIREFKKPYPAREVSMIYHKSELKLQLINALKDEISGVIRGLIAFTDVDIISPLKSVN
ncbi:hydrogen peroxide-inducible genes activator [Wenyingzhuangia marina]|uniref:LysR family transcriptional regulator, hydrogen peroxide-inducible genes activator n=1 Tax=Wenyingzhuangia marina TaxID=1195760 RepID=A0A1M5UP54_9FLAO|nr:hydrogen peroxide-inducible genes activator [Wenyingzhuangia marina]GGF66611.1 transcriptional regulator [Wenyingzhuangia marina]SHH64741.1 LysR family transcriptional regulator, hydrogen peroxide-inducible genes activator [Wenyingzhuangia marina]